MPRIDDANERPPTRGAPAAAYSYCDHCGNTIHTVLKARESGRGYDAVLRCRKCGRVSPGRIALPRNVNIPVVLSWLSDSERYMLDFSEDDDIALGDEIMAGGSRALITALEVEGRRVRRARAGSVTTVWAKRFDQVLLKASIYSPSGKTRSLSFLLDPDEQLSIGDTMELEGRQYFIYRIRTKTVTLSRGGAASRDVQRIYVKRDRFANMALKEGTNGLEVVEGEPTAAWNGDRQRNTRGRGGAGYGKYRTPREGRRRKNPDYKREHTGRKGNKHHD